MTYQALYREWRPQTFAEVVGQPHIVRTIQNMLKQGRVYHAFLFCGPRGTGKTTLAKLLAKALNCQGGPTPEPCLVCPACQAIKRGSFVDVLEIDGASNRGIDEIRDLRERVKYAPAEGRYKVYIIDEVHMLTTEAFNALLKTLEEPPTHVVFVLATTEVQKVPATILSRCQRFDFRLLNQATIEAELERICERAGIEADQLALQLIAQAANGGMRDALSMLDQVNSFAGEQSITALDVQEVVGLVPNVEFGRLLDFLVVGELGPALTQLDQLVDRGKEIAQVVDGFIQYCRNCLLRLAGLEPDRFTAPSALVSSSFLTCLMDALLEVEKDLRFVSNPRVLLELAMFRASCGATIGPGQQSAITVDRTSEDGFTSRSVPPAISLEPPSPDQGVSSKPMREKRSDAEEVAVADSPLTLRQLRQRWPDFVAQLLSEEPGVGAKLASGQVKQLEGNVLTLHFEKSFPKKMLEQADNLQAIQQRLLKEFRVPLRLNCVLIDGSQAQERQETTPPCDEAAKIALTLFEGQEIDSNYDGRPKIQ